mmetsp:Transcript_32565/g.107688  ORF Transcript_32565/g.107688 Transcript_32565/m.107688 type:complete len:191 (+) Transcript_32565:2-574(+)
MLGQGSHPRPSMLRLLRRGTPAAAARHGCAAAAVAAASILQRHWPASAFGQDSLGLRACRACTPAAPSAPALPPRNGPTLAEWVGALLPCPDAPSASDHLLVPSLDGAAPSADPGASPPPPWLVERLLMAVQKNRTTYSKKRIRRNAQLLVRGPKLQSHLSICPVCERTRAPHRVCDREDCRTYFKHRWM